tara:strand:+ start:545 stop:1285 length:741 start_codon:yes stop_codon:yes gene_type:complete
VGKAGRGVKAKDNRVAKVTASDVVSYLRAHPKFLDDHPELFSDLTPPLYRKGHKVVDMQHFMIKRLQHQIDDACDREQALISSCRANLSSQGRVHAATFAVIQSRSWSELVETVTTDFTNLLGMDVSAICIEAHGTMSISDGRAYLGDTEYLGATAVSPGFVDSLLGSDRDSLLRENVVADERIFGDASSLVHSEALLRLCIGDNRPAGLLALGSSDAGYFHSGQGTELLSFLSSVLATCIQAHLA